MLPTDAKARKALPIYSGVIRYFPHALAAVAELSKIGNDQHNPGQPLHWAKEKSTDELDALARHLTDLAIDADHRDPDGVRAAVKLAWRALANLERMHDAGVDIFATPAAPASPDDLNKVLTAMVEDVLVHGKAVYRVDPSAIQEAAASPAPSASSAAAPSGSPARSA